MGHCSALAWKMLISVHAARSGYVAFDKETSTTIGTILLIVLVLLLIGAIPPGVTAGMGLRPEWRPRSRIADRSHSVAAKYNV
jgi:hypothetical protein